MNNLEIAYSEIYQILLCLGDDYISKIPDEFLNIIATKRDKSYKKIINPDVPLENQELLEDTINILALLCLNYWYSDEEKNKLKEKLTINEQNYQNFINDKYNPDNLFKKNEENDKEIVEQTEMILYKESFWKKILKKLFKRNLNRD